MKKISLLCMILLLLGCGKLEEPKPVQDAIDTIEESNASVAKVYVTHLLNQAEIELMQKLDASCIKASTVGNQDATAGEFCVQENGDIVAKNVEYQGFICNGAKTNMSCVVKSND